MRNAAHARIAAAISMADAGREATKLTLARPEAGRVWRGGASAGPSSGSSVPTAMEGLGSAGRLLGGAQWEAQLFRDLGRDLWHGQPEAVGGPAVEDDGGHGVCPEARLPSACLAQEIGQQSSAMLATA